MFPDSCCVVVDVVVPPEEGTEEDTAGIRATLPIEVVAGNLVSVPNTIQC